MKNSNCFESSLAKKPVINHINKTIIVSDAFYKASANPFSNEFRDLMKLREVLPGYEVITRSHRKPRNTEKTPNIPKFVSYDKMKKYINLLPDSEKLLNQLQLVKKFAECRRNSASIVFKWFNDTFPDYRKAPRIDKDGNLVANVNIIPFDKFAKSVEEAEKAKLLKKEEQQAAEGSNELPNAG